MGAKTLNLLKKYWGLIVFVFAMGSGWTVVTTSLASGEANDKRQDVIIEKQNEIQQQQALLIHKVVGQMEVIIQMERDARDYRRRTP